MRLQTSDLPAAGSGFYEVWLLQPDSGKMLPVGVLGASGSGTYTLPAGVLGRYADVDVSRERDDGNPAHSADSVLRGAYGTT